MIITRPDFSLLRALWGGQEPNWAIAVSRKLTLLAVIVSIFILLWRYPGLPPSVPLWYGKPWGSDRLAHPLWLTMLPAGTLSILIINTAVSRLFTRDMLIFSQILALGALLVALLSLITLTKIVFLVA